MSVMYIPCDLYILFNRNFPRRTLTIDTYEPVVHVTSQVDEYS